MQFNDKWRRKKGILFLGKNGKIIFISFDNKETEIDLYNIKRIYFNIKGSDNLRNYTKKSNEERFIQIIELNNRKTDFKFNNNDDLEYFIKGLISAYKSKALTIDKSMMYQKIKQYAPYEEKKLIIINQKMIAIKFLSLHIRKKKLIIIQVIIITTMKNIIMNTLIKILIEIISILLIIKMLMIQSRQQKQKFLKMVN